MDFKLYVPGLGKNFYLIKSVDLLQECDYFRKHSVVALSFNRTVDGSGLYLFHPDILNFSTKAKADCLRLLGYGVHKNTTEVIENPSRFQIYLGPYYPASIKLAYVIANHNFSWIKEAIASNLTLPKFIIFDGFDKADDVLFSYPSTFLAIPNVLRGRGGNDKLYGVNNISAEEIVRGVNANSTAVLLPAAHEHDCRTQRHASGNADWVNVLYGGSGHDELYGGFGKNELYGDEDDDLLVGNCYQDKMFGGDGNDLLHGHGDSDVLEGGKGNDVLKGGEGNDYLKGDEGDDALDGGIGDDLLEGGKGADTYYFDRGSGKDRIREEDQLDSHAAQDKVIFGQGIVAEQLWFSRDNSDSLRIDVLGTSDHLVIEDHYKIGRFSHNRIERFELSNGKVLLNNQVERLVEAMAQLRASPPADSALSADDLATLMPIITASWL